MCLFPMQATKEHLPAKIKSIFFCHKVCAERESWMSVSPSTGTQQTRCRFASSERLAVSKVVEVSHQRGEKRMKRKLCITALVAVGTLSYSSANAQSTTPPDPALVEIGLRIAPVQLNMTGKDRSMVGYGSYLVNAM